MLITLFASALACGSPLDHHVKAAGVTFSWRIEDDALVGRLRADADGWVLVGFNTRPTLDGSRLLFTMVDAAGRVSGEEHIARPPNHHHVYTLKPEQLGGGREGRRVWSTFVLPLRHDELVSLEAGQTVWLTLAWSHALDVNHHSAQREMIAITL